MNICPLCNAQNHHLAVTCSSCKSFLQTRVDTLDLFTTSWGIFDHPRKTFYAIAISRHKNYMLVCSALAGIGLTFSFFWLIKAGEYAETLLHLVGAGLLTGPVIGILSVLLYSLILTSVSHLLNINVRLRDSYAISAYALLPVIVTVLLLLPIEIMTFGPYFFTRNPSPFELKPLSYILLISLDGIFSAWSVALLIIGTKILLGIPWLKAGALTLASIGILGACYWVVVKILLPAV